MLSLILSGSLVITHQIFDSSSRTNQKIVAQAEAAFIFRKVEWLLNDSQIISPTLNATSTALLIISGLDTFELKLINKNLTLTKNSGAPQSLNNRLSTVTQAEFTQFNSN